MEEHTEQGTGAGEPEGASGEGIPDKTYFKIGEVARIVGVKPHVLRYWESEFREVRPQKTKSQQRLYRRRDVELLLRIKKLLYEERYTLEGAKQKLREGSKTVAPEPGETAAQESTVAEEQGGFEKRDEFLKKMRQGLEEILKLVQD